MRGSALIITFLVTAILTLLGISFLLMAETENRIAENERLSSQALFMAEAGTRMVKIWFDHPGDPANLVDFDINVIDRTLRQIDADGDPGTLPVLADGTPANPYYKQNVDLDADLVDDVFDRPYRSSLVDTLLGTENGPDMRIDENASAAARTFLEDLSSQLMADYPAASSGVQARISRIDVYAPPYINVAGNWTRYGLGTLKVIGRIVQEVGGTEQILGERMVKAVLNEAPFPGPFGPIHSCANLKIQGDVKIHWGPGTASSLQDLLNNHAKTSGSWPRVTPPNQRIDLLWGYDNDANFAAYRGTIDGEEIEDPWFRGMSAGPLTGAPNGDTQPYPFTWVAGNPLGDGDWPNHNNGGDDATHSNLFQNFPAITCQTLDYDLWKAIATSGGSDVHYYVWDNGEAFRENGIGAARTFRQITDSQEGILFFDTVDGIAPHDDDSNGEFDNLTPKIDLQGGVWGARGLIYLNTVEFRTKGVDGRPATFKAPGEPFQDKDQDGVFDPGEDWVNLNYPTTLGDPFVADAADTFGGAVMRNDRGPDIVDDAAFWGILFNNGYYDAAGNAVYYGSVVTRQGVRESDSISGTPDFYWDESILTGWPPTTWDLPRVVVTRWETDL